MNFLRFYDKVENVWKAKKGEVLQTTCAFLFLL
jgi:hypothetical protein